MQPTAGKYEEPGASEREHETENRLLARLRMTPVRPQLLSRPIPLMEASVPAILRDPGDLPKQGPFQNEHGDQGCAEERQVNAEEHHKDDEPEREATGSPRGGPAKPGSRRRHHITTELTLRRQAHGRQEPQELVGPAEKLPFVAAMPVPTILSIR